MLDPGGHWPTEDQALLLRAALSRGNQAVEAWREWSRRIDLDQLERGSQRLLPILYRNLSLQQVQDPLMDRLKGTYRLTWYKNQMLFHNMADVLRFFHDAGIPTMVLKGAALTLLHYKDIGARPMEDFDILVPTEQVSAGVDLLARLGWRPKGIDLEALNIHYFARRHACAFENAAGRQLDLHWHVLYACLQSDADVDFWCGAVPLLVGDVPTSALNAADQLLHVCAHGMQTDSVTPMQWIVDLATVLRSTSDIDWSRLASQAHKRRLVLPVHEGLSYVAEELGAAVPHDALSDLRTASVSRIDRLHYAALTCPENQRGPILKLFFYHWLWSRSPENRGVLRTLRAFPRFLQQTWGSQHLWQAAFTGAFKAIRRVWRKAVGWRSASDTIAAQE